MNTNMIMAMSCLSVMVGVAVAQLNRQYKIDPVRVRPNEVTTKITDKTAFGTCACDRTQGQCDAYCCCDNECSSAILDFWKSNSAQYCAKSYSGGKEYKPMQQCVDKKHIYNYNARLGMKISESQG